MNDWTSGQFGRAGRVTRLTVERGAARQCSRHTLEAGGHDAPLRPRLLRPGPRRRVLRLRRDRQCVGWYREDPVLRLPRGLRRDGGDGTDRRPEGAVNRPSGGEVLVPGPKHWARRRPARVPQADLAAGIAEELRPLAGQVPPLVLGAA